MLARIMDNQMWFKPYLRDTSGKGGSVRFAHHLHPGKAACDSGWRYWARGPSRSAIAMAVATAPIATTTTLPALIQAEALELETAALCTQAL